MVNSIFKLRGGYLHQDFLSRRGKFLGVVVSCGVDEHPTVDHAEGVQGSVSQIISNARHKNHERWPCCSLDQILRIRQSLGCGEGVVATFRFDTIRMQVKELCLPKHHPGVACIPL